MTLFSCRRENGGAATAATSETAATKYICLIPVVVDFYALQYVSEDRQKVRYFGKHHHCYC